MYFIDLYTAYTIIMIKNDYYDSYVSLMQLWNKNCIFQSDVLTKRIQTLNKAVYGKNVWPTVI